MIKFVNIAGEERPFFFGYRELWAFTSKRGIEIDQVEQKITMDFDALVELFHLGSVKGVRKAVQAGLISSGEPMSVEQIEDAIDADMQVMTDLQRAFVESSVFAKAAKPETGEKKP
jgi:hypothetical protein